MSGDRFGEAGDQPEAERRGQDSNADPQPDVGSGSRDRLAVRGADELVIVDDAADRLPGVTYDPVTAASVVARQDLEISEPEGGWLAYARAAVDAHNRPQPQKLPTSDMLDRLEQAARGYAERGDVEGVDQVLTLMRGMHPSFQERVRKAALGPQE